jgi:hypothetical protein
MAKYPHYNTAVDLGTFFTLKDVVTNGLNGNAYLDTSPTPDKLIDCR